jgi:hypothetical protein
VAGSPILAADADAGDDRTTDLSAYEDWDPHWYTDWWPD